MLGSRKGFEIGDGKLLGTVAREQLGVGDGCWEAVRGRGRMLRNS